MRACPSGWTAVLAVALGACEPAPELTTSDALVFEPAVVDFGVQPVEEVAVRRVELVNRGSVPTRILRVRLEPDRPSVGLVPADGRASLVGLTLRPNQPLPVDVRFGPSVAGVQDLAFRVETEGAAARLSVAARGARVEPSDLSIVPATLDWGAVIYGEPLRRELRVQNRGVVSTRVVAFDSDAPLTIVEAGAPVPLPSAPLAPGETRTLHVTLEPEAPRRVDAALDIGLSGGSVVRVPVRADVQPAGAWWCPEALDFGPSTRGETVRATVTCDARDGVVRTTGVELARGSALGFAVDGWSEPEPGRLEVDLRYDAFGLAGRDTDTLRITTSDGAVAEVSLAAETRAPPLGTGALSAALEWDANRLDLDLHLVRSGADPFASGDDCYWADKNPEWGRPDDAFDDPFLDRDATDGFGPEEVNLTEAGEARYDVYVQYHDYEEVFGERPTTASVRITLRGAATETRQRSLAACGRMWHVARVVDGRLEWVDVVDERFRELAAAKCR